jgi:Cu(I)/Ag(I) efflux system membrane protein CusA/SilA
MDAALRLPGTTNAWTMPIKNRIDMLATGIRTPIGVKVYGPDVHEIERLGIEVEASCARCRGRARSSPSASAAATFWTST